MQHEQQPFGPPATGDFELVDFVPGEAVGGIVVRMTGYPSMLSCPS